MNKVKRFITARFISLGLILLLAALMYVSTLIPQEIESTPGKIEAWRVGHPGLYWLVEGAQLHRMFVQPWFALLILTAALTLGVSSFDQFFIARKKLSAMSGGEQLASSLPVSALCSSARSCGYRFEWKDKVSGSRKFIKQPWGYFGVVLLHSGMTLVILAAAFVAVTSRQGALVLIEGEERTNRQQWDIADHGLLTSDMLLPEKIRLAKVVIAFDEKQQPAKVTSHLVITDETGSVATMTAAINRIEQYRGLRIYHSSQYGDAFTVRFTDRSGISHVERIAVQQPVNLTTPGYSYDFSVLWSANNFSAKYFADTEKKSMLSNNPELTLRVTDGSLEKARTTLTKGGHGMLGEYRVELLGMQKWSKLIFVDIKGMPLIFAGFAIIMLGGLLHYMSPPRELIGVMNHDGTCRVYWKAISFREFYQEEHDQLQAMLTRGEAW